MSLDQLRELVPTNMSVVDEQEGQDYALIRAVGTFDADESTRCFLVDPDLPNIFQLWLAIEEKGFSTDIRGRISAPVSSDDDLNYEWQQIDSGDFSDIDDWREWASMLL